MNPVLIPARNCLHLTQRCVQSVLAQDIPLDLFIWDNGSTDGTADWLYRMREPITVLSSNYNTGVSHVWNQVLDRVLPVDGHCLVINNDVCLPPWFYRSLLDFDEDFITGVSVGDLAQIAEPQPRKKLIESPDFSAFLIKRAAWETIGPFDERMVNYCGDMDYHIRAHRAGVHLWNAGIHFYHQRSSTLNLAPPEEQRAIQLRADEDRAVFAAKWGVGANDPRYGEMFTEGNFGVDR